MYGSIYALDSTDSNAQWLNFLILAKLHLQESIQPGDRTALKELQNNFEKVEMPSRSTIANSVAELASICDNSTTGQIALAMMVELSKAISIYDNLSIDAEKAADYKTISAIMGHAYLSNGSMASSCSIGAIGDLDLIVSCYRADRKLYISVEDGSGETLQLAVMEETIKEFESFDDLLAAVKKKISIDYSQTFYPAR